MHISSEYSFEKLLNFAPQHCLSYSRRTRPSIQFVKMELMLCFEGINKTWNHPGFTFRHHYQQYIGQTREPYSYTQLLERYQRKYSKVDILGDIAPLTGSFVHQHNTKPFLVLLVYDKKGTYPISTPISFTIGIRCHEVDDKNQCVITNS